MLSIIRYSLDALAHLLLGGDHNDCTGGCIKLMEANGSLKPYHPRSKDALAHQLLPC